MIRIAVVDLSAESRQKIVDQISSFLHPDRADVALLPRVSVKPLSRQELKFHSAPDLLIVGDELARQDIVEVSKIRKLLPQTPILIRTTKTWGGLSVIEQLARMGADDVIAEDSEPQEFLRKLILLARRSSRASSGKLILVDSGKGGLGVTSIAAALGECLWSAGKKTLLIDGDAETQDLSRFLQVKPFINEGLKLIFSEERPVTEDFVQQCVAPVWEDEDGFFCMTPPPESDELLQGDVRISRALLSVLECVDELFDCVIVDAGAVRGAIRRTLYRAADKVVFVVNNDAATLFACAERARRIAGLLSAGSQFLVVENASSKLGLPSALVRSEFIRASQIDESQWCDGAVPYCKAGAKWPASGRTLYSEGRGQVPSGVMRIAERLGLIEAAPARKSSHLLVGWLSKRLEAHGLRGAKIAATEALPQATQDVLKQIPSPHTGEGYRFTERERKLPAPTQRLGSAEKVPPFEKPQGAAAEVFPRLGWVGESPKGEQEQSVRKEDIDQGEEAADARRFVSRARVG